MPAKKYLKIALLLLLVAGIGLTGCNLSHKLPVAGSLWPEENLQTVSIKIKEETFELELALNSLQRERGLSGREEIAENAGMLFVLPDKEPFPVELYFWMKDCLVPIDVIFLGPAGKVTAVHAMLPPEPGTPDEKLPRYASFGLAQFAIELRGGKASELVIKRGDEIQLPFELLLEMAE